MKHLFRWFQGFLLLVLILLVGAFVFRPASPPVAKRKAVVVELFTSEGCSSCPPADALLTRLGGTPSANGAEVIPLGFHVDYWNNLGWQDRFSSHAYTVRQEQYAEKFHEGPYTPQLVVDGQAQLVGNDSSGAENAIVQAAGRDQQVDVNLTWKDPHTLQVLATATDANSSTPVLLAITENDLRTSVAAGENNGHVLHHSAVVRDFRVLGQLSHGRLQTEVPLKPAKDWKLKDLQLVVFAQNSPVGAIQGAAAISFSKL